MKNKKSHNLLILLLILFLAVFNFSVSAAPEGAEVTAGQAEITYQDQITEINQTTNKAAINWQKFSVAAEETVNFKQPGISAVTLNRIVGNEKSIIDGVINADGQVWILNSSGLLFGKNASVNTAALLASTKELSDQDFLAGNYNFSGESQNSVINQGKINISNSGYVALMGKEVSNQGLIMAELGEVHLRGGKEFSLNLNSNSIVNLTVTKGELDSLVENKEAIIADGGAVYLTTNAVDELLKGSVNNEGIIEAKSIADLTGENDSMQQAQTELGSEIILFAHGGQVNIGGTLNTGPGEGFVETSGRSFELTKDAKIISGHWLLDPLNLVIDDLAAETIENSLVNGDVTFENNQSGSTEEQNIKVESSIMWDSASRLTLKAGNSIYINKSITAENSAGQLALYYGQNSLNNNDSNYYVNAPINLKAGRNFYTKYGSEGTINEFQVINDINTLQALDSDWLDDNYALGANIDASETRNWNSGAGFESLGSNGDYLEGVFDGLGHYVKNLYINRPKSYYQGLIGYTKTGAEIKNVGLVNADITAEKYVGGLVGVNSGAEIYNSYVTGKVAEITTEGVGGVGGLVGQNFSSIKKSFADANVTGFEHVGGLVGYTGPASEIINSYALGNASVTGANSYDYIGGLVGFCYGKVINSYAAGKAEGNRAGGLVGRHDTHDGGYISSSYYNSDLNPDSSGYGTAKTEAELKQSAAFSDWDFNNIWTMSSEKSYGGYPTLQWTNSYSTAPDYNGSAYEINKLENLIWLSEESSRWNSNYLMTDSFDAGITASWNNGQGFKPIYDMKTGFSGVLDGNNHYISNLYINRPGEDKVGLISVLEAGSELKNIVLKNVDITGNDDVGSLAAVNHSEITNSSIDGKVSGYFRTGALVGENRGIIDSSYSAATVEADDPDADETGGLVAYNLGLIRNSYSTSTVNGYYNVGGLVGVNAGGIIENSYAAGKVTGFSYLGGLVGYNFGDIVNSYYDQTVNPNLNNLEIGLDTAQIKDPFFLIDRGWDFEYIWGKSRTGENSGYPVLKDLNDSEYDYYVRLSDTNLAKVYGENNPDLNQINLDLIGTAAETLSWNNNISQFTDAGIYQFSSGNVVDFSYSNKTAADYYLDYGSGQLTINQRELTLAGQRIYNGSELLETKDLEINNLVNGENIRLSGYAILADKNAGQDKEMSVDYVYLNDGTGGKAANYKLEKSGHLADITKKNLTVSGIKAQDKVYDGNAAATVDSSSINYQGLVEGDDLSVSNLSGEFADKNAAQNKKVYLSEDYSGLDRNNYSISKQQTAQASIAKKELSISGSSAQDKVYDGSRAVEIKIGEINGLIGEENLIISESGNFIDKNAGQDKEVTVVYSLQDGENGALAANYQLAGQKLRADITRKNLIVSGIKAQDKVYDGNAAATVDSSSINYQGLVEGDDLSVSNLSGEFADKNAAQNKKVYLSEDYSGLDRNNYSISKQQTAQASITKKELLLENVIALDKDYDNTRDAEIIDYGDIKGMVSGDLIELDRSEAAAVFKDKYPGKDKFVYLNNLSIIGEDSANYFIKIQQTEADINIDFEKVVENTVQETKASPDIDKLYLLAEVNKDSLIKLVNGGILLPDGLQQLYYFNAEEE